mgnify:CR=1 FL=1
MAAVGHRVAFGSVAPVRVRAHKLEAYVAGGGRDAAEAQRLVAEDGKPIDDVRSTAEYRRRVCANLKKQFNDDEAQNKVNNGVNYSTDVAGVPAEGPQSES